MSEVEIIAEVTSARCAANDAGTPLRYTPAYRGRVASRAIKGRLQFLLTLRCILQKQHEQDARLLR